MSQSLWPIGLILSLGDRRLGVRGVFTPFLGGWMCVWNVLSEADGTPDEVKRYREALQPLCDRLGMLRQSFG